MNITGKVRSITRTDKIWSRILDLDKHLFPRPWKEEDWNSLDLNQHLLFSWEDEKGPIGFALFASPKGDETAHLLKILVIPEKRGGPQSSTFWKVMEDNLREKAFSWVYLEVEETNLRAIGFYEKLGFRVLRRVKSYYSDGEAAVMMQLTL